MPLKINNSSEKQAARINKKLAGVLEKYALIYLERLIKFTATWEDPPVWKYLIKDTPNGFRLEVFGESDLAEGANVTPFHLIDIGTKIRFAWMTPDFKAKTTPGSLVSGPGKGGFSHLGSENMGIEARKIREQLNDELFPELLNAIRSLDI